MAFVSIICNVFCQNVCVNVFSGRPGVTFVSEDPMRDAHVLELSLAEDLGHAPADDSNLCK